MITKEDIEKLAEEVERFLEKNEDYYSGTFIFYNGCEVSAHIRYSKNFIEHSHLFWDKINNIDPRCVSDAVPCNHIFTIDCGIFLLRELRYGKSLYNTFSEIFKNHRLYLDKISSWVYTAYPINKEEEVEYTLADIFEKGE